MFDCFSSHLGYVNKEALMDGGSESLLRHWRKWSLHVLHLKLHLNQYKSLLVNVQKSTSIAFTFTEMTLKIFSCILL